MKEIKFVETKDEIQHFFPSVHSGVIDCSRAKKELNFKATPLVLVEIDRNKQWHDLLTST